MSFTRNRRLGTAGLLTAIVGLLLAATAWACVPVASLNASPGEAAPGEQITLTGRFYANDVPVTIHFNSLDGPVLGTFTPTDRLLDMTVRIPRDAAPGNYVLIANQERPEGGTTWGIPSRALVTVVGDGGTPALSADAVPANPVERAPALASSDAPAMGELALVALGVAGVALFLAGMAALLSGRRQPTTAPVASGARSRDDA